MRLLNLLAVATACFFMGLSALWALTFDEMRRRTRDDGTDEEDDVGTGRPTR